MSANNNRAGVIILFVMALIAMAIIAYAVTSTPTATSPVNGTLNANMLTSVAHTLTAQSPDMQTLTTTASGKTNNNTGTTATPTEAG